MPESPDAPLDLSLIDDQAPVAQPLVTRPVAAAAGPVAVEDARLAVQAPLPRLVEVANLSPEDLAAANASAARLDFRKTSTLLAHGDGVLAGIASASRELLTGVRLGDAGAVGQIAAAVIDGVKILRIQDLQAASSGEAAPRKGGLIGKFLGVVSDAQAAYKGFKENRKKFLELMDTEVAKARKVKADLGVTIELLDEQAVAIRKSLHDLKIEIAAGQIAIDRAQEELEALRQHAGRNRRSRRCRRRSRIPRRDRQLSRQDRGDAREPRRFGAADPDHRSEQTSRRDAADEDLERHARRDPRA